MKKLVRHLVLLSFLTTSFAIHAKGGASRPDDNLKAFCTSIEPYKSKMELKEILKIQLQLLQAILFPDKLALPKTWELKTKESNLISHPSRNKTLRNVILYAGTTPGVKDRLTEDQAKKKVDYIQKKIQKEIVKIRAMLKTKDTQECQEVAKKKGFSLEKYEKLLKDQSSLFIESQLVSNESAVSFVSRSVKDLNLEWELIPFMDTSSLMELLKEEDLGNVVIVTHATSGGMILDSNYNEIPPGVFSRVSPSIYSISVFSCHEESMRKRYKLDEKLLSQESMHLSRLVFTPTVSDFLGKSEGAPLVGLSGFMKRVDKAVSNPVVTLQPTRNWNRPEMCTFDFLDTKIIDTPNYYSVSSQEFQILDGAYSFSLNGKLIGVVEASKRGAQLNFPCDLLRTERSNVLINLDMKLHGHSKVYGEGFSAVLHIPGEESRIIEGKQFYRKEDGSYRSSKFLFDL